MEIKTKNMFDLKKLNSQLLLLLFVSGMIISCQQSNTPLLTNIKVSAPFDMPAVTVPDFDNCPVYNITDFGAVNGDLKSTTSALEKAIEAASNAGGGRVIVPPGEWNTGKIHLKSNVNLHLEEEALLLFSENPADYLPPVHTTWEGMECYNYSPLIYAYGCKNIAISGKGEIKAKLDVWKKWFSRPQGHMESLKRLYYLAAYDSLVTDRQMVNDSAHFRPQFIQFNRCENILLEGITITNSPFWTIHPYLSKNVLIRDVKVKAHGHNNDGVDPEMSQNILIEDCIFDQGDDAIAVKSGRNQDAWRLNTPSKNIVVRNCKVINGHQLLAIGSELSGGIENIFIDSCEVVDGAKLYHLLFIKTNERRGGYVKNIFMSNIKSGKIDKGILGIETDVLYQWRNLVPTIERKLTPISDITLSNIEAKEVDFIYNIQGDSDLPVENISLNNVRAMKIRGEAHHQKNLKNLIIQ